MAIPLLSGAASASGAVARDGTHSLADRPSRNTPDQNTPGRNTPGQDTPGQDKVALGLPPVQPRGGTHWHNFCGSYWKNIISNGTGFNIYNDDWHGVTTCLYNNSNPGFVITRSNANGGYHAFPNISSGWQWGVAPRHGFHYPVQLRHDGHPISSVSIAWNTSGIYNAAYDMWFSTYKQTNGQDNGAEVMIWLNCNKNCIGGDSPIVTIEGVKFHEISWMSSDHGVHWRYTAFVAVRHRTSFKNLWLNPFYWAAHVNRDWYLTSIDFGFELVTHGRGLRVNHYSLNSVF